MKTYKDWKKKFKKEDGGGGAGGGAGGGSGGAGATGSVGAANNVGSGNIAGVGVGPAGEPGVSPGFGKDKKRKKLKISTIDGMLKANIKENNDNNNVILKQVLDGLDKVDVVIDNLNSPKVEIKIEQKQSKKSFREKYKL